MSDERLRDLERRWRAGGAPDDDARLVLERLRGGQLAQVDVDLAALLGHPAACAALGRAPGDLRRVCETLAATDARRGRAALALAELALPAWTWPRPPEEPVPGEWVRDAVQTLRLASTSPGAGAVEAAQDASGLARDAAYESRADGLWAPLAARAVAAACDAFAEGGAGPLHVAARLAASLFSEARVREALASAVLPEPLRPARASPPPEWCGEVDLLRRRLAEGRLSPERLALAHALGHGPAGEVLGFAPAEVEESRWLEAVGGAGAIGAEAGVRSLVALAVEHVARDEETAAGRAIRAAEAWLVEPTSERALAALAAAREADAAPDSWRRMFDRALMDTVAGDVVGSAPAELGALAARAAHAAGTSGRAPLDELRRAAESSGDRGWLGVAASEVLPWSLRYVDAVHARLLLDVDLLRRLSQ